MTVKRRALAGSWINDAGSVLDLRVHDDGRVSGTFRPGREARPRRAREVVGRYLAGDRTAKEAKGVVASVLGWPEPQSVTVWCGQLDLHAGLLRTEWLTARVGAGAAPAAESDAGPPPGGAVFRRRWRRPGPPETSSD